MTRLKFLPRTSCHRFQKGLILVTNLGLKSLRCPRIGRFHFMYWEVTGAREVHVRCTCYATAAENQRFSFAFTGNKNYRAFEGYTTYVHWKRRVINGK